MKFKIINQWILGILFVTTSVCVFAQEEAWQTATELVGSSYVASECADAIAHDPTIIYFPKISDPDRLNARMGTYFAGSRDFTSHIGSPFYPDVNSSQLRGSADYLLRQIDALVESHFVITETMIETELKLLGETGLSANQFIKQEQIKKMTALIQARVDQLKKTTKFCVSQSEEGDIYRFGPEGVINVERGSYDLKSKSVRLTVNTGELIPIRKKKKSKQEIGFYVMSSWSAEFAMSLEDGRWWEQAGVSDGFRPSQDPILFTLPKSCPKGRCEYDVSKFTVNVNIDGEWNTLLFEKGILSLVVLAEDGSVQKVLKSFKRIR